MKGLGRVAYHSAPVGARSKLIEDARRLSESLTTVLRWERDQNESFPIAVTFPPLPQCSGGSEIKTDFVSSHDVFLPYHSAPVGARSKPV